MHNKHNNYYYIPYTLIIQENIIKLDSRPTMTKRQHYTVEDIIDHLSDEEDD